MRSASTEELLRSNRPRRFRTQKGTLIERRDGFYLRYYIDTNNGARRKVTERLCDLNTKQVHVTLRLKQRMFEINTAQAEGGDTVVVEQTIGDFFKGPYTTWAEDNLKASTWRGYQQLWAGVLEPELGNRSLQKFRRVDGSDFLTSLVRKGYGHNSMLHAQTLLSGIFTRAVAREIINNNPMHGAKSEKKARAPKPRIDYTNAEVVAVLSAITRPDAKLFWSLCCVLGMRPSEACGLQWPDISVQVIHVQRAAPYGIPQDGTKSELGDRKLLLIEPVKSLLAAWKAACGDPSDGWVFRRPNGQPIAHSNFARLYIATAAKKAIGARWAGCYPGRHSAATQMSVETKAASAAHQVLGNSLATVTKNYVHPVQEAGDEGLRLREQAIMAEMRKSL